MPSASMAEAIVFAVYMTAAGAGSWARMTHDRLALRLGDRPG